MKRRRSHVGAKMASVAAIARVSKRSKTGAPASVPTNEGEEKNRTQRRQDDGYARNFKRRGGSDEEEDGKERC